MHVSQSMVMTFWSGKWSFCQIDFVGWELIRRMHIGCVWCVVCRPALQSVEFIIRCGHLLFCNLPTPSIGQQPFINRDTPFSEALSLYKVNNPPQWIPKHRKTQSIIKLVISILESVPISKTGIMRIVFSIKSFNYNEMILKNMSHSIICSPVMNY